MLTKTQQELLNLANEAVAEEKFSMARDYLIEANKVGVQDTVSRRLVEVELLLEEKDQAYLTLRELPDLFSNLEIFALYQRVLVANSLLIEQLQVIAQLTKNYAQKTIAPYIAIIEQEQVTPLALAEQNKTYEAILTKFARGAQLGQAELYSLHQLELERYLQLVRFNLLSPNLAQQNRIVLVEDLVRLVFNDKVDLMFFGEKKSFIPANTKLFQQTAIYRQGIQIIEEKFYKDPTLFAQVLSEFGYCLQLLYPVEQEYISDVSEFLDVLVKQMNGMLDESESQSTAGRLLAKIYNRG